MAMCQQRSVNVPFGRKYVTKIADTLFPVKIEDRQSWAMALSPYLTSEHVPINISGLLDVMVRSDMVCMRERLESLLKTLSDQ